MQQQESVAPRVAFVTECLDLGGTTTFLCNLAGELVRQGVTVEIISFEKDNPLRQDFEKAKIPLVTFDEDRWIFEDRLRLVLERLKLFRPTVVIANLAVTAFEVLRYLPRGILRVGTVQSHDDGVYEAVRHYGPYVEAMAAVSRTIEAQLRRMPEFARTAVHYLPYGIPVSEVAREVRDFEKPLRILYLGRLQQQQKRVRLFPMILQRLRDADVPVEWTIAGPGPESEFLQGEMKSSARQQVRFIGKVLYQDVPKVLRQHDIFLLCSDYEGLPLSLLEAMGAGLVPVVSDLESGIREVVGPGMGMLIPPDEPGKYPEAIEWLHLHREEFSKMSASARARVKEDFSVAAMTRRWLQLIRSNDAAGNVEWPQRWKVFPPAAAPSPFRYSAPARMIRRLLLRVKGRRK